MIRMKYWTLLSARQPKGANRGRSYVAGENGTIPLYPRKADAVQELKPGEKVIRVSVTVE